MSEQNGPERTRTESATDELRRMLDERGVRHFDGDEMTCWGFEDEFVFRYSADEVDGGIQVTMWVVTPAQAVEATLGRRTCRMRRIEDACYDDIECSECGVALWGFQMDHEGEGVTSRPRFCPNCGAKVVNE